ncbi:MAG: TrbG/VirB9 family P-type conjugative transfer protein [Proteobacteria bacterium]|nr:TrbG/VirB9 family P-type conjugative transfer protein [Pseudomonadota bacterium]
MRLPIALLPAVVLLLHAREGLSETVPTRGVADARIRSASYDANEVYRLQGHVGYEIDLQFEQGESFVGIGAGDIDALSFVSQDNHLFIKPKAARINTNLTVLTNRRPYQFAYSASALRSDTADPEIMFVVRFSYPPNNGDVIADGINRILQQSRTERPGNGDYWYCGSRAIQPTSAMDDGIHTRLRFAPKAEQPAVFVKNDDGTESLLNFSIEGSDVVIHRVVRQLIIRRGRLTGLIVNKGFTGSGARLDSGTVSSSVERVGEGRRP